MAKPSHSPDRWDKKDLSKSTNSEQASHGEQRCLGDRVSRLMIGPPTGTHIWIVAGVTDLRRGSMGFSGTVQTTLEQSPFPGHVFIFRERRGDLIKLLWYSGDLDEKIRPREIHLAASDEWNSISDAGAALHAARRDRLETTGTHLHSTAELESGAGRGIRLRDGSNSGGERG